MGKMNCFYNVNMNVIVFEVLFYEVCGCKLFLRCFVEVKLVVMGGDE